MVLKADDHLRVAAHQHLALAAPSGPAPGGQAPALGSGQSIIAPLPAQTPCALMPPKPQPWLLGRCAGQMAAGLPGVGANLALAIDILVTVASLCQLCIEARQRAVDKAALSANIVGLAKKISAAAPDLEDLAQLADAQSQLAQEAIAAELPTDARAAVELAMTAIASRAAELRAGYDETRTGRLGQATHEVNEAGVRAAQACDTQTAAAAAQLADLAHRASDAREFHLARGEAGHAAHSMAFHNAARSQSQAAHDMQPAEAETRATADRLRRADALVSSSRPRPHRNKKT